MTPAQEQAASAGRRACVKWLNGKHTYKANTPATAGQEALSHYVRTGSFLTKDERSAFLAAWRAQWEAR